MAFQVGVANGTFKNPESRKKMPCLEFLAFCIPGLRVSFFSKFFPSRSLAFYKKKRKEKVSRLGFSKSQRVSVSNFKTPISPSRKISAGPFATPYRLCNITCTCKGIRVVILPRSRKYPPGKRYC